MNNVEYDITMHGLYKMYVNLFEKLGWMVLAKFYKDNQTPKSYISKLKILKRGYASLEEIIKHTHLNDKYLQFQNIIITNKRSNDAYVYTAELGKFILCDKREILEELIVYRMDDLVEFYNEYKNKLDPKIVKVLEKMFKLKDEDEYIDKKTNDFNIVFYNLSNKDLLKYKKIDELTV
jgi:hypothetical protein